MRWWAMIPPIAAYSRGHMHNPPNHPLHGAGCNDKTLWYSLDKLYDSTKLARIDLMTHQYTVSIAFDNWQQQKAKTWQNMGSSAVFLNGVAAFLVSDKTSPLTPHFASTPSIASVIDPIACCFEFV